MVLRFQMWMIGKQVTTINYRKRKSRFEFDYINNCVLTELQFIKSFLGIISTGPLQSRCLGDIHVEMFIQEQLAVSQRRDSHAWSIDRGVIYMSYNCLELAEGENVMKEI